MQLTLMPHKALFEDGIAYLALYSKIGIKDQLYGVGVLLKSRDLKVICVKSPRFGGL